MLVTEPSLWPMHCVILFLIGEGLQSHCVLSPTKPQPASCLCDGAVDRRENGSMGTLELPGTSGHKVQLPYFKAEKAEALEKFKDLLEVTQLVSDRVETKPHFPYLPGQSSFCYVTLHRKRARVALSGAIFQSMSKEKCYIYIKDTITCPSLGIHRSLCLPLNWELPL